MAISVAGGVRPGRIIDIEHRLYRQLIVGAQRSSAMHDDDLDTKIEDDATKLAVEREAVLARLAKQLQAKEVYVDVSSQLIDTVINAIDHRLASPALTLKYSGVNEGQLLMLEMLQSSKLNLNTLRQLISDQNWLVHDLTTMVNSQSFRHRRPQRSDVHVTDIKLVLNFIGLENLKLLIPYFCLRNWLPSGHANLLWTTRKLWRYSIVSGIAAQTLAKLHQQDGSFAYTCALLSQLGPSVVLSSSATIFEQTWGAWLREACDSRDKELHDAVLATEFPSEQVYQMVLLHGNELNWQLLHQLKFDSSDMASVLTELDNNLSYNELSRDAALVSRATCFAKVYLLEEMHKLEPQEKQMMFDYYQLTQAEIVRLSAQNYRKLDII